MLGIRGMFKPIRNIGLVVLLLFWQVALPLSVILAATNVVEAAPQCVKDTAGANDEPGQKDLTQLCEDDAPPSGHELVSWNWDELGTSGGGQSLDACGLFDSDGDGFINFSICVTAKGNAGTLDTVTIYTCTQDSKVDRCGGPDKITGNYATICSVGAGVDPFPTGDFSPNDRKATCDFALSDLTAGISDLNLKDVCSYPSREPNSDPSDCVIIQTNPIALIEVIKDVVPDGAGGLFDLSVDGPVSNDKTTVNDVGDGGSTGIITLSPPNNGGTAVVSEAAGTGTNLANYSSRIDCMTRGTTTVVAQGIGTSIQVPVKNGDDIVCTITNRRLQATLILQKTVINDDGGTLSQSNFPVAISGNSAQWGSNTVSPSSYTVSETQQTGYAAGSWGGDCDANGNVSLADGQTKTCTITNNDIAPQLTVIKNVTNDNGGTLTASNFTMLVNGTDVNTPSFAGSNTPGTTVTLDAGSYSVTETGPNGYSGSFSADCTGSIAIGEHKYCTVTNNDDAPRLTILKNVTNDNGGTLTASNFILHLSGGSYDGSENFNSGATPTVVANTTYSLSEDSAFGYNQTALGCVDDTTNSAIAHPVTLNPGQHVTCTITNNDIAPKLTVTKIVTNDNGGTLKVADFPLWVDSLQVTSGVSYDFNAGTYTVSETQQSGYTLDSISGDCLANGSITMVVGGVYACTVTNNDQPAQITVTKVVTNDNGGTGKVSDFELYVGATKVSSGITNTFNANQSYAISEHALIDGYTQDSIVCIDNQTQNSLGSTFTPTNNQRITCTITNNDNGPTLTLTKNVIDTSNNPANPNQWALSATPASNNIGATVISGDGNPLDGSGVNAASAFASVAYTLSESGPNGFTASDWVCTAGNLSDNVLVLALGEHATCSITNTKLASLRIIKDSQPNDGQDFTFHINAQASLLDDTFIEALDFAGKTFNLDDDGDGTLSNQETTELKPGTYLVNEDSLAGWDLTGMDCGEGVEFDRINSNTIAVTLEAGAVITCTFTNQKQSTVNVLKYNDFNQNGQHDENEPTLAGWEFILENSQEESSSNQTTNILGTASFTGLKSGTYSLKENIASQPGWNLSTISCDGAEGSLEGETFFFDITPGSNIQCKVGNYPDAALEITKANNRPNPTTAGDVVTYTLTINVPEDKGAVFDATVTDLPPQNFVYVKGSWTASSSVRGDLKANETTPEPTYGSPGTWLLGRMLPGEVITLTYQAKIANSVISGNYPDIAFAGGCSAANTSFDQDCSGSSVVLANISTGQNTPFVHTAVAITTPEVLGASTVRTVLVNTGTTNVWHTAILAATMILLTITASLATRTKKGGRP